MKHQENESKGRTSVISSLAAFMSAIAWPAVALIVLAQIHDPLKKVMIALPARVADVNKFKAGTLEVELSKQAEVSQTVTDKLLEMRTTLIALASTQAPGSDELKKPLEELDAVLSDLKINTAELKAKREVVAEAKNFAQDVWYTGGLGYSDLPTAIVHLESKGGKDTAMLKTLEKMLRAADFRTDTNGPNRTGGDTPKIISHPDSSETAAQIQEIAKRAGYSSMETSTDPRLRTSEFIVYTADTASRTKSK